MNTLLVNVSVITIVRNDVNGIAKTIESVLNQTKPADQYIIIDGDSTDGTLQIIENYRDKITLIVSESDAGIYDAMNKGWKQCNKSNYIIYCNSTDYLEPNAIESFLNAWKADGIKKDIYHGMLNFVKHQEFLYVQGRSANLLGAKMIEHPAAFVKHDVFLQLNGFDLKYRSASDYDFMLRAYFRGFTFRFVKAVICNFSVDGISSTSHIGQLETLLIRKRYSYITTRELLLRRAAFKLALIFKKIVR